MRPELRGEGSSGRSERCVGFIDWFKGLFRPREVTRDVSGLDATSGDLDQRVERVDTRGGPLRPQGRRRALRDPRLLPKPPSAKKVRAKKRPRLFTRSEATRLFSATLRTTRRDLRDLLPDEAQLERLNLPRWLTEADLAAALGVSVPMLRHFSVHRERERVPHYVAFARPKKGGGERIIRAPKRRLKALQRALHAQLTARLPVHDAAHAFRPGRSIKTNAAVHAGARTVVKLDLAEFFPSITFARVRGYLIGVGYGFEVATTLAVLMTEPERQPVEVDGALFHVPVGPRTTPQGAPTSPGLANALVARMDRRLAGLARARGLRYSRYADDLTFSSTDAELSPSRLIGAVRAIVEAEGFTLNRAKTRVLRRRGRQAVAGVTLRPDGSIGLSKRERREVRALAHRVALGQAPERTAELHGKLAYLAMLDPERAARLRAWAEQKRR